MTWQAFFRDSLREASDANALRKRRWHIDESSVSMRRAGGQHLVNFATNDYLGLRHDWRLTEAVSHSLASNGVGAGASPLVSGYNLALADLEARIARWQGTEASLVFSSGMSMNMGVVAALVGADDLVLSDRLNHASLIDGCRLSGAHKRIFAHNDPDDARKILQAERARYKRCLMVTESVFSMDGDQAPLDALQQLCNEYDAGLLVDEAHACGVYGEKGAGMSEVLGTGDRWLGKLGTLGKALGTSGGYVAGSRDLINYLVNRCRTYIFSTAIAPPVVAATAAAVSIVPELGARRAALARLSVELRSLLRANGWNVPGGDSPIVPVIVGENHRALELSQRLLAAGFYVPAIRPPTVPTGTARLRISLCALHTLEQIHALVESLQQPDKK